MLFLVSALKLTAEIALLALLGQSLLGVLVGARRQRNPFYQVLQAVGRPFVQLARRITPGVVLDRHVPLVAFLLLLMLWLAATVWKIRICLAIGLAQCQ